jgi:hypothetical protein
MKTKLLLLIALIAIAGGSVTVLVVNSNARKERQASQLPTALSNYSQTFKLNTNPPLWPEPQKSGGTNGRSGY